MITLLLATAFNITFPGGAPNDFAAAIAEGTKQNVVLSQGEAMKVAKAEFETTDLDLMARALRSQTEHAIMPGTDLVISNQLLARRLVSGGQTRFGRGENIGTLEYSEVEVRIQSQRSSAAFPLPSPPLASMPVSLIGLPATAVKGGLVTFKTEKADALQLQLLNGVVSKLVKFHWIYTDVPVFVQVKDMPELDFMKWVAKAVGSRLVSTGKEYSFELDPVEIRKRAIATINHELKSLPQTKDERMLRIYADSEKAAQFRIACLNGLSPAQLSEALATPGGTTQVQLTPRNSLTNLAVARVRQIEASRQNTARGPAAGGPPAAQAPSVLQRVDPNRTAILIVDSKFTTRLEIPVVDGNGRPAGVVRM